MADDLPDLLDGAELHEEDDRDDDDEAAWMECDDEDQLRQLATCLFCENTFKDAEETYIHCKKQHQFDIVIIHKLFSLDDYGYIKLINFIRKTKASSSSILTASGCKDLPWDDDQFMQPALEDDVLLQCDPDEFEDYDLGEGGMGHGKSAGQILVSHNEMRAMVQRVKAAEERSKHYKQQLHHATETLAEMQQRAKELLLSSTDTPAPSHQAVQNLRDDEDDVYFNSYSHFSIHAEMLKDKVRTEYYRDCLLNNTAVMKDTVVLDVGCGTGILSMFAAKAGAAKVIGIDMSDIAYNAMDIVKENGLDSKISILKGRMEDIKLPVEKVDVIISEWMGYFLLFESMLDTVLWARDHYLSPGGRIVPDQCKLYVTALADPTLTAGHVDFWDNVYGCKMSCMKSAVTKEPSVCVVADKYVVSKPCCLKEIDINTCSTKDLEFSSPFELQVNCDCKVNAIVGYFDIDFNNCPNKMHFSTSPASVPTHWKQTVFMLQHPLQVNKGDTISGNLTCRKNRKDPRSLDIAINMTGGNSIVYYMQ